MLTQEPLDFRVKVEPLTAHDCYGAWREGEHDDLVRATALPVWYAERQRAHWPPVTDPAEWTRARRQL